jgi:nitrate/nitrite-specific signal transduction histidine kinase
LEKGPKDEIGTLIDGFNQMLSQIQERDRQLAAHQIHLEEEVKKQTSDLRKAMNDLKEAKEAAEASVN